MRFSPACNCCGSCTGSVTASSSCNGTISGATYKLVASDGVTVVATLTGGTSVTFSSVAGGSSYYVEVSKTGYHTKRSTLFSVACGASVSKTVSTWPTTYSLTVNVKIQTCDLSGATVAVTGDSTGSGSTDGSGNVTLSLSSSSSAELQSLSYTVTPPTGHGAAVKTGSWSIHACSPTTQSVGVLPSAGHVAVVCNRRYMPEELEGTSNYGSCTVAFSGDPAFPMWFGSFTYTSEHCFDLFECFPPLGEFPFPDQTADVTVTIALWMDVESSDCDTSVFRASRNLCLEEGLTCPEGVEPVGEARCQPVSDHAVTEIGSSGFANCSIPPPPGSFFSDYQDYSCPASISMDFAIAAVAAVSCGTYEETEDTITFTGTIA